MAMRALLPAVLHVAVALGTQVCNVGDKVSAFYADDGSHYAATLETINDDGTYTVAWDDGDTKNKSMPAYLTQQCDPAGCENTTAWKICVDVPDSCIPTPLKSAQERCIVDTQCATGHYCCPYFKACLPDDGQLEYEGLEASDPLLYSIIYGTEKTCDSAPCDVCGTRDGGSTPFGLCAPFVMNDDPPKFVVLATVLFPPTSAYDPTNEACNCHSKYISEWQKGAWVGCTPPATTGTPSEDGSSSSSSSNATGAVKVSSFETKISVEDAASFDEDEFLASMAGALGDNVAADAVKIKSVTFMIEVGYSISADPYDEAKAKTGIAAANGVEEDMVTLSEAAADRRRLADSPRELGTGRRNAASTTAVTATIATEDKTKVADIQTAAADPAGLDSALAEAGMTGASSTVDAAPATSVAIVTEVRSEPGGEAIQPPSTAALLAELPASTFGENPTVDIGEATITTEESTADDDGGIVVSSSITLTASLFSLVLEFVCTLGFF